MGADIGACSPALVSWMLSRLRLSRRQFVLLLAGISVLALTSLAWLNWLLRVYTPRVQITRWRVRPPGWNAGLLTVAFVTDTHSGAPWNGLARLREIVEQTNALGADIIVLGGDYVYHGVGNRRPTNAELAQVLGELRAPQGVFAVLGNHDYWDDPGTIEQDFTSQGIQVLSNRGVSMGSGRWWIAGVSDYIETVPDVTAALQNRPDGAPVLFVSHVPDLFRELPPEVNVTLSGHTHGGQVALPWVGPVLVPSRYGTRYARGIFEESGRMLVVSAGLGTTGLPVRRGVPAEVVLLEIEDAIRG
jgi:predicted MPP superfamily phosphohydrolase